MWALAIFCLATLVAAAAPTWEFFFGARVLAGLGTGAEAVIIPTFLTEFIPGRVRGRFIGMLAGFFSFCYVGAALLGRFLVPTGLEGWRLLHVVAAVPILLLLWWRRSIPESPRFLLNQGQVAQARAIVERIEREAYRRGGVPSPVPALPAESVAPSSPSTAPRVGIGALWRRGLARRTALLWLLWTVITFSFYGFFTFMPTLGVRLQDAASTRSPSISTMQARQLPSGR